MTTVTPQLAFNSPAPSFDDVFRGVASPSSVLVGEWENGITNLYAPSIGAKAVKIALSRGYDFDEPRVLHCLTAGFAAFVAFAAGTSSAGSYPVTIIENVQSHAGSLSENFGAERRASLSVPAALAEVRKRAALTWSDLASVFAVSRRAVHMWANGQRLSAENDAKVRNLHAQVQERQGMHPHMLRQKVLDQFGLTRSEERKPKSAYMRGPILEANASAEEPNASVTKRYARGRHRQV